LELAAHLAEQASTNHSSHVAVSVFLSLHVVAAILLVLLL
jgi:hypothetical protein